MKDTLDKMLLQLSEAPEDWPLRTRIGRLAYMVGRQTLSECMLWTARQQKRAYHTGNGSGAWFDVDLHLSGDPSSDLPTELFRQMDSANRQPCHGSACYQGVYAAECALILAWAKARAAGWVPEEA